MDVIILLHLIYYSICFCNFQVQFIGALTSALTIMDECTCDNCQLPQIHKIIQQIVLFPQISSVV